MSAIRVIAGLGNPGKEYESTRHNVGADIVRMLATRYDAPLKVVTRFHAEVSTANLEGADGVRLLVPTTYMNDSGRALSALLRYYKIPPEALLVIYDELDLAPGRVRLKLGGGTGGHNGIKDIVKAFGDPRFWRLRVGIGRPAPHGQTSRDEILGFVLRPASHQDLNLIEEAKKSVLEFLPHILSGDMQVAMNQLHAPPEPPPPAPAPDADTNGEPH